jgi:hypothetical protein
MGNAIESTLIGTQLSVEGRPETAIKGLRSIQHLKRLLIGLSSWTPMHLVLVFNFLLPIIHTSYQPAN